MILAVGLVAAAAVAAGGFWFAMDRAAGRISDAVANHARSVDSASERIGQAGNQIGRAADQIGTAAAQVGNAAAAVDRSGEKIHQAIEGHAGQLKSSADELSKLQITLTGPVEVKQPVIIRGPANDGSLPVDAKIGK